MRGLSEAIDFQSQALVLRAERQRLMASNIANADTPGYQAREMDFANALRQATLCQRDASGCAENAGDRAAALGAQQGAGFADRPDLLYARHSQDSIDRNTVDLDRERASFVDNSVKYEATLRFINAGLRSMFDAMKSPSQG